MLDDIDESKFALSDITLKQITNSEFSTLANIASFLWHHLGCGSLIPYPMREIYFDEILSELKRLDYWPNSLNCNHIRIQDFDVSDECRNTILRNGIQDLAELIQAVEYEFIVGPNPFSTTAKWVKYIPEIIESLQKIGCWPDCDEKL